MKVRTDTQCAHCIHNQVCAKLNKPINLVENLIGFNAEDDNDDFDIRRRRYNNE